MADKRATYAFERYMFGADAPERTFDPTLEAVREFNAASMLRLVTPTDNFSIVDNDNARNKLASWSSYLKKNRESVLAFVRTIAEHTNTQHAFLGALMQALQKQPDGQAIWKAGKPEKTIEAEKIPPSLLCYMLAVQLKNMAQQAKIIEVNLKSGQLMVTDAPCSA